MRNLTKEQPGLIIKTDGTEVPIQPANGKHFTLKELQEAVGGYIEGIFPRYVRLSEESSFNPETHEIYADEEGVLKRKHINVAASRVCGQTVVGDVVIIHNSAVETESENED